MLGEIAEQTERYLKFEDYRDGKALEGKLNVSAAVGSAAVSMVEHIKAACIVTPTMSGQTARLISNLRPSVPIYGVTPYEWTRRKMQLYWGVRPVTGYEEDLSLIHIYWKRRLRRCNRFLQRTYDRINRDLQMCIRDRCRTA